MVRRTGDWQRSERVRVLLGVCSRDFLRANPFLLVNLLDVDVPGDARVACSDMTRPRGEDGTHDGAPDSLLGYTVERQVVGRGMNT